MKHRSLQLETHLIHSDPPDAASDMTTSTSVWHSTGWISGCLQRWIWSKRADEKCVNPDVKKSMFSNEHQTAAIKNKALNLPAYESSCLISFLLMYIWFSVRRHTWLIFILNKTTLHYIEHKHFIFLNGNQQACVCMPPLSISQDTHTVVYMSGAEEERVNGFRFLGITITDNLSRSFHSSRY